MKFRRIFQIFHVVDRKLVPGTWDMWKSLGWGPGREKEGVAISLHRDRTMDLALYLNRGAPETYNAVYEQVSWEHGSTTRVMLRSPEDIDCLPFPPQAIEALKTAWSAPLGEADHLYAAQRDFRLQAEHDVPSDTW